MENFLIVLIAYILGVLFYTLAVRWNGTNKYVKEIKIWPIVWEGAKGMAIGFAVVAALMFVISKISMLL